MRPIFCSVLIAGMHMGLGACSLEGSRPTILDAAAIYRAQPELFAEILDAQRGRLSEFTRIPARDPAKETAANKALLKRLRKDMPVEFIDFFPRSASGRDEVSVVIKRYGITADWTVVGVVYMSIPLSAPQGQSNDRLFDNCDSRVLEWTDEKSKSGSVSVFCRLNTNWYAFQKVG